MELTVDINTENMQRKLRVISSHAEALADELQEIDDSTCPECGSEMDETRAYAGNELTETGYNCEDCDYCEGESW